VNAADGIKELFHFLVVFFAGRTFHTAVDVDGIRTDFEGLQDIVRADAAGEKEPPGRVADPGPVEGFSAAAVKAVGIGVQQDRIRRVRKGLLDVGTVFDPNGLDQANVQPVQGTAEIGCFLSVKLNPVEPALLGGFLNLLNGGIDKDADRINRSGDLADDFPRLFPVDVSRAFGIEDKTQHVCAESDGRQGVFQIGNSTDFYFCKDHTLLETFQ